MAGKSRPILIAIIAILTIIVAILSILGGVGITFFEGGTLGAMSAMGLVMGIVLLIIGIALWSGWKIAWYIGVIIYAIYMIFVLFNIAMGIIDGDGVVATLAAYAISLIICVLILFYLFRPKVKEFFGV
jgi:uncharacterized membrane protein (DUF2068 family)